MSILLDKQKGLNPILTECRVCRASNSIVFMGNKGFYAECPCCEAMNYGNRKCGKCGYTFKAHELTNFKDGQRMDITPCGESVLCRILTQFASKEILDEAREILLAGGAAFKCDECGCCGFIKGDAPVVKAARKVNNVDGPFVLGFSACAEHGGPAITKKEEGEA